MNNKIQHQTKILLVGGCGYIGSFIYTCLGKIGIVPIVCDTLARGNRLSIPVIQKDYADLSESDLYEFDVIIWFAGHSSVQQSILDPDGALANNCLNLFGFAKKLKPTTKLIYASTGSLYSAPVGQTLLPSKESDLVHIPYQNAYDISRFAFDYLAQHFLTNFYSLRMGTLSGYSPNIRKELIFNSMSIDAATTGKVYLKNPDAYRTVLFLEDLWLLIKSILFSNASSGFYNVGSVSITIGQLAELIAKTWNAKIIDQGSSETYSFMLDTSRMDQLIGTEKIHISIEDQSKKFIKSCFDNQIL